MDRVATDFFHFGNGNIYSLSLMVISSYLTPSIQGPVVGMIYDRYGTRQLLFFGTILHILGVMMTSLGKEYYQILLAQGVCSAIGVSAIFTPGETAIYFGFSCATC